MPKPVTGSTKDYYVKPGTNRVNQYGSRKTYTTGSNKYTAPKKTYTQPVQPVSQPKTTYTAPATVVSTPTYSAPQQSYSAPQQNNDYMQSYLNQMQSALQAAQQQAAEAQRRAEEQMRAAQEAQRKAREEAYQRSAAQQKTDYEYGQGQLNSATDSALQQAYINKMMNQRTLAQQLAAQGIGGGAAETTTSRNALETERAAQLASLLNTYQNNMAQLENQKASGDAADLSQYQTNLSNLTANNANNLISLMQGYANMAANMPRLTQKFNTSTGQWEYSYE
jgi:hypothetical protein